MENEFWDKNKIIETNKSDNTDENTESIKKKEKYVSSHEALFKSLHELKKKRRQNDFQEWLNKYTMDNLTIREIISFMVDEVKTAITLRGFLIKDENLLKNNIATFVYNYS